MVHQPNAPWRYITSFMFLKKTPADDPPTRRGPGIGTKVATTRSGEPPPWPTTLRRATKLYDKSRRDDVSWDEVGWVVI